MALFKIKKERETPPDPRITKELLDQDVLEEDKRVKKKDTTKSKHFLEPRSNRYEDRDPKKRGTITIHGKEDLVDKYSLEKDGGLEDEILGEIDNPDKEEKQHSIDRNLQGDEKIKPGSYIKMKGKRKSYKVIDIVREESIVALEDPQTGKVIRVDISVLDPRTVSGVWGKAA